MKKRITTLLSAAVMASTAVVASTANPADTNGDGKVSKEDATLIYNYILGTADDSVTVAQVDVNGDNKVNTADVVEVYRTINISNVNVTDWETAPDIDGGEAEEEI